MSQPGTSNVAGSTATPPSLHGSGVMGMFTPLETMALLLAGLTLYLIYGVDMHQARTSGPASYEMGLFVPHIILIGVIIAGLRRIAALLAVFILLGAALIGLAACLASITGDRDAQGLGFAAFLQLPLFILCFIGARRPVPLQELATNIPRLALGAVVGALLWLGAGVAVGHANAPYYQRVATEQAAKDREAATRDARALVIALGACLQRAPATPDSQPMFPGTLAELPRTDCPEAARPSPAGFLLTYVPGPADSAGLHRAFRLTAHNDLQGRDPRTFEIDETMILHEFYGSGTGRSLLNSGSITDLLAKVGQCVEQSRDTTAPDRSASYPPSLAAMLRKHSCGLTPNADTSALVEPMYPGSYVLHYTPPAAPRPHDAPGGYTLSLEPARDSLGRAIGGGLVSFFVDTAGNIHTTPRARAATAADPVIPDCPDFQTRLMGSGPSSCRTYALRQRWGLVAQMPMLSGWSQSGNGTVGTGETLFVIPQYQPIVETDRLVEAHIQWETGGPEVAIRPVHGVLGETFGSATVFRLQHVYSDTGMKEMRFRARAASGDEYEMHQQVRVLLGRRRR